MTGLAETIAGRLAAVDGVVAVVLGGSRASGRDDPESDLDLGLYYEGTRPPSRGALREVATALQGSPADVTGFGEWGPWVNGGGWLTVEGVKVDWIYRELARVRRVFDECIAGRVTCDYYLGHPHGYHSHYYLAEVYHARPLYDPEGVVAALKARLRPYPSALRQALIEKYLYDAGFMLDAGQKSASRADVLHAVGCLFRCAAALVQVVFALNEEYTMNEKSSLPATDAFPIRPRDFARRVARVLAAPGDEARTLAKSYADMREVLDESRRLAPPLRYAWPPASAESESIRST